MGNQGVDICNDALVMIGDKPVLSIDPPDDSDRARACARLYPRVRDEVLRAHPWSCAKRRATLTLLATAPIWEYANAFQLPTDPYCLRVLKTDLDEYGYAWKLEGRTIITDESTLSILYIARIEDVSTFDPLLVSCIATRLAANLAVPLTGGKVDPMDMWKLYGAKLQEAQTIDGMESGSIDVIQSQDLVNVRY